MHRPLAVLTLISAGVLCGQPPEVEIRPGTESRLALTVEKTGLWSGRKHVFVFEQYTGKAVIDRSAPERSSVELSIDAASATCHDDWVSEKDRAKVLAYMREEMLDVAHHPRLIFRSNRIAVTGSGSYEVSGMLEVRGIGKPVTVTARLEERNSEIVAVNGQATVRLRDYGLTPPKAALGAIGTKNEMTVSFRIALPQTAR